MEIDQDILHEIEMGRNVSAIKLLKDRNNIELKEAKKIVDQYLDDNNPQDTAIVKVDGNKFSKFIILTAIIATLIYLTFKEHPNLLKVEPIIFIYFLLGFFAISLEKTFIVPARSVRTQGKVIGYTKTISSSSNQETYAPDIEFAINNTVHKSTSPNYNTKKKYSIGDSIEIQYDPVNPSHIETNKYSLIGYILFMLIPPVFILVSFDKYSHMPIGWFIAIAINALMIPGIIDRYNKAKHNRVTTASQQ